ncbi:hypothetical protein [Deinococcus psychrotolerans]|nr:hypothetical protein [Deinococcus psychrotolerans]
MILEALSSAKTRRSIYRLDLDIVSKLLDELSRLEGRKVIITDLIEKTDH